MEFSLSARKCLSLIVALMFASISVSAQSPKDGNSQADTATQTVQEAADSSLSASDGRKTSAVDSDEIGEIDQAFRDDIRKHLSLTKDVNNRYAFLFNQYAMQKARIPGVSREFWDECDKLYSVDGLAEYLIPIYAQHYSHEEIIALNAFFESPVGKKFVMQSGKVMGQSAARANDYAIEVMNQIKEKLDAAGYRR